MQEQIGNYTDKFQNRHIGPNAAEIAVMLAELSKAGDGKQEFKSIDEFVDRVVPPQIRMKGKLKLRADGLSEYEVLKELRELASKNKVFKSYIGLGYYDTITPPVIQRNILENPGWYTQYTPYQAEIAQGRLEALLNFQTMISDLTGLPVSNASLLDEGTAVAEAMHMCSALTKDPSANAFFVSEKCHPQTIEVLRTRCEPLGVKLIVGDHLKFDFSPSSNDVKVFGAAVQYPATDGSIEDFSAFAKKCHEAGALFVVAADLMALCLLKAPSEFGADIVVGSAQRFGVPMGYGGPHAAFLSTKDEYKRQIPGRLVGVSVDVQGRPALRLALQTREQHIRRAKATSNICTAQVLLAIMASMYAVYHGPEGLKKIAARIHSLAFSFSEGIKKLGFETASPHFFDTISIHLEKTIADKIYQTAIAKKINIWISQKGPGIKDGFTQLNISFDETKTQSDVLELLEIFDLKQIGVAITRAGVGSWPRDLDRKTTFLTHPLFNSFHSETEILRYMRRLQSRDLSLTTSMIPLGSCTMKLNATAEMFPVTWPEFGGLHPFVPLNQAQGYKILIERLESWLGEITGFSGVSLQPNAGSQGEYAGLLVIRAYHQSRGESHRNICLIPTSAHGTNPASSVMANMEVVPVECEANGNVSLTDLKKKAELHAANLAALMVTYPSTHGVFEEEIQEICATVHKFGGQVYMDGANMNAQVGLCRPADFGADVCHLNLHKTFCIPHGGGGPGMGPIGVKEHLREFLPGHSVVNMFDSGSGAKSHAMTAVSAAPWGSASILPISYAYIAMMGGDGLTDATKVAILSANYMAARLNKYFPVLYRGKNNLVAHECIVDMRPIKARSGVEVSDIAKRLMDFGFHAPTVSWPVAGTMMIEPTESEGLREIDRFCDAMIAIAGEAEEIASGKMDKENNPLKNAPHTAEAVTATEWARPYSREQAAFPYKALKGNQAFPIEKFWPPVSRINDPYGDRNLVCSCPPMSSF